MRRSEGRLIERRAFHVCLRFQFSLLYVTQPHTPSRSLWSASRSKPFDFYVFCCAHITTEGSQALMIENTISSRVFCENSVIQYGFEASLLYRTGDLRMKGAKNKSCLLLLARSLPQSVCLCLFLSICLCLSFGRFWENSLVLPRMGFNMLYSWHWFQILLPQSPQPQDYSCVPPFLPFPPCFNWNSRH